MTSFNDIESNGIETEKTPKSSLFTLKNAALALGILAALGLATVGSLRLLRGGSKLPITPEQGDEGEENEISNSNRNRVSSSTPCWFPFFAGNSLYGINPKQVDNKCTLLNDELAQSINGSRPKLSKDEKFVFYFDSTRAAINRFDLDAKTNLSKRTIWSTDNHFVITSEKLIKGITGYDRESDGTMASIRRYDLNSIGTEALSHEDFKTNCEKNQLARVLAVTSDGSKVFYACENNWKNSSDHKNRIYFKDYNADPDYAEDSLVCEISKTPDWFLISPADQFTVHFVTELKMILIREIQTGEQIAAAFLGDEFDFSTIKNIDFSKDGKSIHIINSTGEKEATIRTIDFKKLLNMEANFLGEPQTIEFPSEQQN